MGVVDRIRTAGAFDVDRYMAFLQDRPDEQRWQLVDGVAQRLTSPTVAHLAIVRNLLLLLEMALRDTRQELAAYPDVGIRIPGVVDFQPEPDVAILSADASYDHWADHFVLIAEVQSRSNDAEQIARKVELYCSHSDNRHVLVVDQDTIRVTHRARDADWRPVELGEADRLSLPEFGFDVAVTDIYRGTKLAPRR